MKEAQRAGIAHARTRADAYLGRKPSYDRAQVEGVVALLGQGSGIVAIARETGLRR